MLTGAVIITPCFLYSKNYNYFFWQSAVRVIDEMLIQETVLLVLRERTVT